MRRVGVGATVRVAEVPLSAAAVAACASDPGIHARLLGGGDDYEILAAVPPARAEAFADRGAATGLAVTAIGAFSEIEGPPVFVGADGVESDIPIRSYSHF